MDWYTAKSPGRTSSLPFSRSPITDSANEKASPCAKPTTEEAMSEEQATANAEPSALAWICPIRSSSERIDTEQVFPLLGLVHNDSSVGLSRGD